MTSVLGGCHCGAIRVRFMPNGRLGDLAVRACGCTFCRKHGARTTTDPLARLEIEVRDDRLLVRYRFGLATCDYFVCASCGVYVAAVLAADERAWATLNINTLEPIADDEFAEAKPVHYDLEDRAARIARRMARWTPTELRITRLDHDGPAPPSTHPPR
jgi:hypothetical protein